MSTVERVRPRPRRPAGQRGARRRDDRRVRRHRRRHDPRLLDSSPCRPLIMVISLLLRSWWRPGLSCVGRPRLRGTLGARPLPSRCSAPTRPMFTLPLMMSVRLSRWAPTTHPSGCPPPGRSDIRTSSCGRPASSAGGQRSDDRDGVRHLVRHHHRRIRHSAVLHPERDRPHRPRGVVAGCRDPRRATIPRPRPTPSQDSMRAGLTPASPSKTDVDGARAPRVATEIAEGGR